MAYPAACLFVVPFAASPLDGKPWELRTDAHGDGGTAYKNQQCQRNQQGSCIEAGIVTEQFGSTQM